MAFFTGNSLTGVFPQARSSLDGHNNSAELSSILGRDTFAALFSVSENTSFFTRPFVVKFGVVVLVTVHWNTMVRLSYCLSVTSPSKFLLGVLKSVDGFAAIAVAMLLMLAIIVCFQFCGYGGGRSPVSVMRGSALLAATLGLRHIWLPLSLRTPGNMENYPESVQGVWFPASLGLGAGTMVTALLIFRALGFSTQLSGEGLLKRKGQSSTSVLLGNVKKSVPFFPQADQVFFDLSSIQVAWRTAAAAHMAALLLIVAPVQQRHSSRDRALAGGQAAAPFPFFRLRYLIGSLCFGVSGTQFCSSHLFLRGACLQLR